jgi:hypothetical protein
MFKKWVVFSLVEIAFKASLQHKLTHFSRFLKALMMDRFGFSVSADDDQDGTAGPSALPAICGGSVRDRTLSHLVTKMPLEEESF